MPSWLIKPKKPAGQITEADVTADVKELLKILKIPFFKHKASMGSAKGVTDIIGTLPVSGRGLWLEIKRPGKEPTEDQWGFMRKMAAAGGLAFWADSAESVLKQLAAAGYEPAKRMTIATGRK